MRRRFLFCALAPLLALTMPAHALERSFPAHAKRGTLSPAPFPQLSIDGKARTMTPGGRIWSAQNLIVVPADIGAGTFAVNYTETDQGEIDRVWILTPAEASKPSARQQSGPFR